VQNKLNTIAIGDQPLNYLAPNAALLIFGQHGDRADVGIGGAIGNAARKPHKSIAVPGRNHVQRSAHQLSQSISIGGATFPADDIEERR